MKILQVDVNYGRSSTGKIIKDLQFGLEARGHVVKCCYGRGDVVADKQAVKITNNIEVYVHAALTRLTGYTGIFSPGATRNLISIIEEFNPDVVHLHELHGYYVNIGSIVRYLHVNKIPIIWTFHCEFMYTGKCGHAYDCERWKIGCGDCPQLNQYPSSIFFDRTNLMFQQKQEMFSDLHGLKIIAPSKWLADRIRQSFLSGRDIDVVYNGIDTKIFQPCNSENLRSKLGIKTRHIIVSIAPDLLSGQKGGRWVLELAKRMERDDVTFVMVGVQNPDKVMSPNVIAVPKVSDQSLLAEYYSLGDLFLLTSKRETFSLVCAESLACGTPVIGFDAGAPSEVAPNGYGLFVDYANLDELHKAVLRGLHNRDMFESRLRCAEFARKTFSKDSMTDSYILQYENLLQKCI